MTIIGLWNINHPQDEKELLKNETVNVPKLISRENVVEFIKQLDG